jgi:hypothetical protein
MINFENSSNCCNPINQGYFQYSLNMPNTLPTNEIKQEFYYSHSESSDSGSYESNPSPSALTSKQFSQYDSNFCVDKYQNQENDLLSDSTMESSDDDCYKAVILPHVMSATINRGGRKQVKQGTTKRNARERNRVRYINNCFEVLRRHIPSEFVNEQKNRKLSKFETLKFASIYIKQLTDLLKEADINKNESIYPTPSKASHINNHVYVSCSDINGSDDLVSNCFMKKTESPRFNEKSKRNGKIVASHLSTIQFNNININIYDNKNNANECQSQNCATTSALSSPTLTLAASTHLSTNNNPFYYPPNNIKKHSPVYFNCGKASSLSVSSAFFANSVYQPINLDNFL